MNYDLLLIASVVVAVIAAALGWYSSAMTIRAKIRAQYVLASAANRDAELRQLITSLRTAQNLPEEDLVRAQRAIEMHLSSLSEKDRSFIEEGLHQPSRAGARRFAREVLAG